MDYDAIIIGARCAGAATAMQLARGGKKVLVLDRTEKGTDIMSTHALMRGAVLQLDNWGLLDRVLASGVPVVNRTCFHYGDDIVDVPIRPAYGTEGLIAPRRYILDNILVEAAKEAGAEFRFGASFVDVLRDRFGRVNGVSFDHAGQTQRAHAKIVIGADGRRSTVARRVNARVLLQAEHATSCVYAYFNGLPDEGFQWFYNDGIAAGFIPTHNGQHCVFASSPLARFRPLAKEVGTEAALRQLVMNANPTHARDIETATTVAEPIVFGGDHGFLREASGPGWALVGDAGYFKDPLTAHGITDAFRDAELLSRTILSGASLHSYEDARNASSIELFELTDRIAAFDWTLDELKVMHLRLNEIMKAEQASIAGAQNMPMAA